MGRLMRQRLRNFFPVLLIALAVQVIAPIGAAFATTVAASERAWLGEICHHSSDAPSPKGDDGSHGCDDGYPLCCAAAQIHGWLNVPQLIAIALPPAVSTNVDWSEQMSGATASRPGSNGLARAPPRTA